MKHCLHQESSRTLSRRGWLAQAGGGFGSLALAGLLSADAGAAETTASHVRPRAKSIIYLYMEGGPSQIDSFDPKASLDKLHGKPLPLETPNTVFNIGKSVLRSPFEFRKHGESGADVSEIFPHIASIADKLTIVRSMHHGVSNHSSACLISHTGYARAGKPCMGSWLTYGLGRSTDELPSFVVLDCGQGPSAGSPSWSSGFLPASLGGTVLSANKDPVDYIRPADSPSLQKRKLEALRALEPSDPQDARIDALIESYERAYRMQTAVPRLLDISDEPPSTRNLYGLDDKETSLFGSRCLLARRLVEQGVRFVELFSPRVQADRWDQHANLEIGHRRNAIKVDRPIAGLIRDLESRGMLDETIVLWGGEFGRTPNAQGKTGRDHNPFGYTVWAAGGGFRPGIRYGMTDEFGYYASEDKVHLHDLHATLLHQLGLDHERLTYRFGGRDFRLTDVHGDVVEALLD